MKGDFIAELVFGTSAADTILLSPQTAEQTAIWEVDHEKTPLALNVIAQDLEPFNGNFSISVPGITVDGLSLMKGRENRGFLHVWNQVHVKTKRQELDLILR